MGLESSLHWLEGWKLIGVFVAIFQGKVHPYGCQLTCDQPQEKEEGAEHDRQHGSHTDAASCQDDGDAPQEPGCQADKREREKDPQRIDQHRQVQNFHDGLTRRMGPDRA